MGSHTITNSSRATVLPHKRLAPGILFHSTSSSGQQFPCCRTGVSCVPDFLSLRCTQFCVCLRLLLPPATSVPKSRATIVNSKCKPCILRTREIFCTSPNRFLHIVELDCSKRDSVDRGCGTDSTTTSSPLLATCAEILARTRWHLPRG